MEKTNEVTTHNYDAVTNDILSKIRANAINGDTCAINIASLAFSLSLHNTDYVNILSKEFDYAKSTIRSMKKVGQYVNKYKDLIMLSYSKVQELTKIDITELQQFIDYVHGLDSISIMTVAVLRQTINQYYYLIEKSDDTETSETETSETKTDEAETENEDTKKAIILAMYSKHINEINSLMLATDDKATKQTLKTNIAFFTDLLTNITKIDDETFCKFKGRNLTR